MTVRSGSVGRASLVLVGLLSMAQDARAADVTGVATLAGTVTPRKPVKALVDRQVCGDELPDERVSATDGKLAGVVVWFEGVPNNGKPAPIEVDQARCRFQPRVSTATEGAELVLVNSDPTLHTVHAYAGKETSFNVATPIRGQRLVQKLEKPGLLELRCDAGHPWMQAWIHVFPHPFHALSAADGTFTIRGVPAGKWKAKAWHEAFGTVELGDVELGNEPKTLPVAFDAKAVK